MKSSIISFMCASQKNIPSQADCFNQCQFDDSCDLNESDSESGSQSPTLSTIYNNSIKESWLVKNKGNIKHSEKKQFIENLEKQLSLNEASKSIRLTPCFNNDFSSASNIEQAQNVRNKKSRKVRNWNRVKRSITISPFKWFGPKIWSPANKDKVKKTKKYKKSSSTTLKSKQTSFSSSKALNAIKSRTKNLPETNNRSKSSFTRLFRIPEIAENDEVFLTILDI